VHRYEVAGWKLRAGDFKLGRTLASWPIPRLQSAVRLRYSMSTINGLPPVGSVSAKPRLRIMPVRHGAGAPTMN